MPRFLLLAMLFAELAFAQANAISPAGGEIFRCPQPDGTIAFQGMPCEEPESAEEDPDEAESPEAETSSSSGDPFDFVNPFDEPMVVEESPPPAAPPPLSPDRAECEKTARDAIDAIDLRMRQGYTKEEGQAYMAELLELTRALRACKTL